jgi:hypothetical protein
VRLDLQVEQLDLVTGAARGRGHQLETERLQAKIDSGVHQAARMNG